MSFFYCWIELKFGLQVSNIWFFIFYFELLLLFQVDIWEERKVFGSRGQGLKDEMLGKNPPPQSASNGKSSNPIKIVKRDAQSVRIVSI